jgi:hypothetical protein
VTEAIVFFFFATTKPQKTTMAHCRRLRCCSKTKTKKIYYSKTKIKDDNNFAIVAFFIAAK